MVDEDKSKGAGLPDRAASTQSTEDNEQHMDHVDARLIPGGRHGSHAEIGMSAMDRAEVPSGAEKPEQLDVRDTPEGIE